MSCAPKLDLPTRAEQVLERLVAEEVDALLGEVELDLLRRRAGLAAGAEHATGSPGGTCGAWLDVEVALVDQPLDDLVEQLAQLALDLLVPLGVAGGLAAEHLEHVGRELARVHQRLEDRLPQRVERALALAACRRARTTATPPAKPRLQQEVARAGRAAPAD